MKSKRLRWFGWLLTGAVIASLILFAISYRPFQSGSNTGGLTPGSGSAENADLDSLPNGVKTFLVMGVDTDEGEDGRSDSMMVVSYNPKLERIAMLSIPRDIWTQIPGHGYDKINHAYAYGGHELAVNTVERLLGIDINHWVSLSFDGFTKVIDAVGGIDMNPTESLYYVDPYDERMGPNGLVIDIAAGPQVMDGLTALKYARFRADAEGDLGRMRRQQEVIKAVIKKAATPAMLSRAGKIIPALYSTVGTDMSVGEILALATSGNAKAALANPLVTDSLKGDPHMIEGIFYFGADLVASRTAAYELLVGSPPDAAFVQKAERDKAKYDAALADALARSEALAQEAERDQIAQNEAQAEEQPDGSQTGNQGENGTGTGTEGQEGDGVNTPGSNDNKQPPQGDKDKPGNPPGQDQQRELTVNLVDATGKGIAAQYVAQIEALGFRVDRLSVSTQVLPTTLVLDRVDHPQAEAPFRSLFPGLIYTLSVDPYSEQAFDIVLGTDLLANP